MGKMVTRLHGAEIAMWSQSRSNRDNGKLEVTSPSGFEISPAEERVSAQQCSLLQVIKGTRGCGRASDLLWNCVCLMDKLVGTQNTGKSAQTPSQLSLGVSLALC